jgi:hypothetical protein
MTKPYRPSNGFEGMDFQKRFCFRCEKDRLYRKTDDGKDGCQILSLTYLFDKHDPRYPKEWVEDERGARCTAFEPEKANALGRE